MLVATHAQAQTLGGNAVFSFAKLSNTPQLTALGGINVSAMTKDVGMSFHNPALLRSNMHGQLNAVFNSFYAGINNYHVQFGYHHEKLNTNFAAGINYFDYGNIDQTDAAGNRLGIFNPNDFTFQIAASRRYLNNWHYGITLKLLSSNYGVYKSSGLSVDVGIAYYDSVNQWQSSFVVKNMGGQLSSYGRVSEEMPFDVQWGISKRLAKAPFAFSLTAHHLHRYNIVYNDTLFNNDIFFDPQANKTVSTGKQLISHFIFATQIFIGDKIEVDAAYDFLRGTELSINNASNGLNGFSFGLGVNLKKISIKYARSYYQNNTAWNQLGLNFQIVK